MCMHLCQYVCNEMNEHTLFISVFDISSIHEIAKRVVKGLKFVLSGIPGTNLQSLSLVAPALLVCLVGGLLQQALNQLLNKHLNWSATEQPRMQWIVAKETYEQNI